MTRLEITWNDVLHWRCRRQLLHRPAEADDPVTVARALVGVQAQVASSAEQAVAARQRTPEPAGVRAAIGERRLVKTWAARGTLHVLAVDVVAEAAEGGVPRPRSTWP